MEHTRDSALLARERWQDCPLSALVGCVAVFAPNHFSFIPSSSLPARTHDASVPTPEAGHELTQDGVLSDTFPVEFCASERTPVLSPASVGRRCSLAAAGPVVRVYKPACQPLHHAARAHKKCSSWRSEIKLNTLTNECLSPQSNSHCSYSFVSIHLQVVFSTSIFKARVICISKEP